MNANLLVKELMAAGLTQMEIESHSGIDQSVVSALNTGRHGKRTPYATVVALDRLLKDVKDGVITPKKKSAQADAAQGGSND